MAQSFELEGTVKVIDEVQTFASGFTKREFVVEVEPPPSDADR
jgi:single-strand DNA-binding protein